jgi:small neutral amino acid transporter SnatA (MarC family)
LIGVLLAALAVQLMLDGLHDLGIINMLVGQ